MDVVCRWYDMCMRFKLGAILEAFIVGAEICNAIIDSVHLVRRLILLIFDPFQHLFEADNFLGHLFFILVVSLRPVLQSMDHLGGK